MFDLKLNNINFYYKNRNKNIINKLNTEFKAGQITALIGNNGSGKTTLLKIISGLFFPKTGTISIDNIFISKKNILFYKNLVGYMPEFLSLYPEMKVNEILKFLASLKNVEQCPKTINTILGLVNLLQHSNKKVKTLSKGMKQRLNLAQALILKPPIILFDEPSNGLDYISILIFYKILKILSSYGSIIILSSHHLNEVYYNVNRVIVLSKGTIVKEINISLNSKMVNYIGLLFYLYKPMCLSIFLKLKKIHKMININNELLIIDAIIKENDMHNLFLNIYKNNFKFQIKIRNNIMDQFLVKKISI